MKNSYRQFVIYEHANSVNGKSYVGWAKINADQSPIDAMNRRWCHHKMACHYGSKTHFHCAIRVYDESVWSHEVLDVLSTLEATKQAEKLWIEFKDSYKSGYNMTLGGDGVYGYIHTEESRRKNSEAHKGYVKTPSHLEKLRRANVGKKRSVTTCDRISSSKQGENNHYWKKHLPKEMCLAISLGQPNRRKVLQYTKNGKDLISTFTSLMDAERMTGVPATNIAKCCRGHLKTAGKFVWYYDDTLEYCETNIKI